MTIDAPIADVWPWLAQIGEDRGGFYSYSLLERAAVGAHVHNANSIHPEWQDIRVGRNFSRWMSPVGVRRLSWRSPGWCSGLVG